MWPEWPFCFIKKDNLTFKLSTDVVIFPAKCVSTLAVKFVIVCAILEPVKNQNKPQLYKGNYIIRVPPA